MGLWNGPGYSDGITLQKFYSADNTSEYIYQNSTKGEFKFDGIDDYIDLPDGFANFTGGLTFGVWAYPTDSNKNWARFIELANGSNNNNILFARNGTSNDLTFEVYNGTETGGRVTAAGAIELNKWQYFAATMDNAGNVKIYKNGVLLTTTETKTAVPQNVTRVNNYIGKSNWIQDGYYQGNIAEVQIYNRELCAAEINSNKTGNISINCLVLEHNYRSNTAEDISLNGNNGTIYGGVTFNVISTTTETGTYDPANRIWVKK
ncbi:MAG: LamG domain-containing protein [Candidatus Omnitrophota bacterium]